MAPSLARPSSHSPHRRPQIATCVTRFWGGRGERKGEAGLCLLFLSVSVFTHSATRPLSPSSASLSSLLVLLSLATSLSLSTSRPLLPPLFPLLFLLHVTKVNPSDSTGSSSSSSSSDDGETRTGQFIVFDMGHSLSTATKAVIASNVSIKTDASSTKVSVPSPHSFLSF